MSSGALKLNADGCARLFIERDAAMTFNSRCGSGAEGGVGARAGSTVGDAFLAAAMALGPAAALNSLCGGPRGAAGAASTSTASVASSDAALGAPLSSCAICLCWSSTARRRSRSSVSASGAEFSCDRRACFKMSSTTTPCDSALWKSSLVWMTSKTCSADRGKKMAKKQRPMRMSCRRCRWRTASMPTSVPMVLTAAAR
mmetsp:Transcript_13185/g.44062  ORF Transcript_13185/g.44062 Transcript_13185/m.44062 type:complete len:200 (+) Transcript_13185:282-881(+)